MQASEDKPTGDNSKQVLSRVLSLLRIRSVQVVLAVLILIFIVGSIISRNSYDPAYFSLCTNPNNTSGGGYGNFTSAKVLPINQNTGQVDTEVLNTLPEPYRATPGQVDLVACLYRSVRPETTSVNCTVNLPIVGVTVFNAHTSQVIGSDTIQRNYAYAYTCAATKTTVDGDDVPPQQLADRLTASARNVMSYSYSSSPSYFGLQGPNLLFNMLIVLLGALLAALLLWYIVAPSSVAAGWALRDPSVFSRIFSVALAAILTTVTFGIYPVVAWIAAIIAYLRDQFTKKSRYRFAKNRPFYAYGGSIEGTQLVFGRKENDMDAVAAAKLLNETVRATIDRYIGTSGVSVEIIDIASDYNKAFIQVQHVTPLATTVSIILNLSYHIETFRLMWFALARGRVKFFWQGFWFVFYAPFTFFSWGIPTLRGTFSVRAAIAAAIDFTYDYFDITGWLTIFQQKIFDGLIIELDKAGFDVQYYKENPINFVTQHNTYNLNGAGSSIGVVASGNANNATVTQNINQRQDGNSGSGTGGKASPVNTRPVTKPTGTGPDIDDPFAPVQPPVVDDPFGPVK